MATADKIAAARRAVASNRGGESVVMSTFHENDTRNSLRSAGCAEESNARLSSKMSFKRASSASFESSQVRPTRRHSQGGMDRRSGRSVYSHGSVFMPRASDNTSMHSAGDPGRRNMSARSAHRAAVFHQGDIMMREKSTLRKGARWKWCFKWSRTVVDHKIVVLMSVLLTMYALTGDDWRLLLTDKDDDPWFDGFTIVCISFFSMEIILSCFGKHDYYMGFFFFLDLVATITLVLDLTWVSNYFHGDDFELGDRARSSRSARIGASVGRMVRVLRLIRIFKLYKAYYTAKKKRQEQVEKEAIAQKREPGIEWEEYEVDDGWDDEDSDVGEEDPGQLRESLVGKKLSALTTRRTIILVLTMLLVLPLLRPVDPLVPSSAVYGADNAYQAFLALENGTGDRKTYERHLLKFLYYHSWFTGQKSCPTRGCASDYFAHVFWFGFAGENTAQVESRAALAYITPEEVAWWEDNKVQQDNLYNYSPMPTLERTVKGEVVRESVLVANWTTKCEDNVLHLGVSMLREPVADYLSQDATIRCPSDLRIQERGKFNPLMLSIHQYKESHLTFYFDLRPFVKLESLYSLGVTFFVCIVLCVASVFFANDANRLVLHPVEQMITKIEAIRENPLIAMKMADDEFKLEEVRRFKTQAKENRRLQKLAVLKRASTRRATKWFMDFVCNLWKAKDVGNEMNETVILEKTIIKLGWLLSLVFGEAGANIVSQNMSGSTAGVNAMVAGSRVDAIIGHARIRNFSTATEVLQGKVMTFVNQVAEIVHGIVDEFHGAANQNNGNTFLIIWRIEGNEQERAQESKERVSKLADMSVLAFAKIIGHVHRSPVLAGYRTHPGLQQRLGSDHKVSLTFGLHAGWAIEGAVGSEFKIDASYLSPNVSVAASLERATKQYGVSFLASQAVLQICNKPTASKCRLIDKVRITGLKQPIELFTLDLDFDKLDVDRPPTRHIPWNVRQRFRARQLLEAEKNRKWSIDLHMGDLFDDADMKTMRRTYTVEFLMLFNMGYQNYSQGEWQVARRVLSQTHTMLASDSCPNRRDGPSGALLAFMEATYQFEAPEGWHGVRDLLGTDFASDL